MKSLDTPLLFLTLFAVGIFASSPAVQLSFMGTGEELVIQTAVKVRHAVKSHYVDEVSDEKLSYGLARGMTQSLDPNSTVFEPKQYEYFRAESEGSFGGLGIMISVREGWLTVISPLEGSPAHEAGVRPGDRIVRIDGEACYGISTDEAVSRLRGKPGSSVTITVERAGRPRP